MAALMFNSSKGQHQLRYSIYVATRSIPKQRKLRIHPNANSMDPHIVLPLPNSTCSRSSNNQTLDFYVAWNMNDFQQWSVVYYTAMFDGGFLAGTQVWNTIVAFEHLKSADVKVEVLLAVLTLALGLISPSGWATQIQATLYRRNRPRMSPSATKYPVNTVTCHTTIARVRSQP